MLKRRILMLRVAISIIVIGAAFLVGAILITIAGSNPLIAYFWLFKGSFGSFSSLAETLIRTTPILLVSQGLAIAFTARLWNIGAEGQLYIGGMSAAALAIYISNWSPSIGIPVLLLISGLAGAAWAFLPAFLRAYYEINEILTTIMLNYIASYFVSYLLNGPFRDPVSLFPETQTIDTKLWLPLVVQGTRLHIGVLLAILIVTPFAFFFLSKTSIGVELAILGSNPEAARYSGLNSKKLIILSLLISGFLAGLAGGVEVLGIQHKMRLEISPGYGFTGIAVALLGYLNPIGVLLASFFLGGIINGSTTMHRMALIPVGMAFIIQALIILFIMLGYYAEEKLIRRILTSWGL